MHEGMTSSLDLQKLSTVHERIAHTSSEDGIARLASPDVESSQRFFRQCGGCKPYRSAGST